MQKIQIIGRIGQDAEVKDFNSNQVINFSVAVSERWKSQQGEQQEKTTWYDCSKWGNNTNIAQYLTRGTQVYVEGTPECRAYMNKEGEAVSVLGIKVFSVELLGSKEEAKPQSQQQNTADEFEPEEHEDLPF